MNLVPRIWRPLLLILALLLAGCGGAADATPTPCGPVSDQSGQVEVQQLAVLGTIRPARTVQLGFAASGTVQRVCVTLGEEVRAGDPLACLDAASLELDVRQAAEALALSQARLDQGRAGPSQEAVAVAEAEYQRAEALHTALLAGPRPSRVAAFQAEYEAALARFRQVKAGACQEELIVAGAAVDKAEGALQRAQAAYDLVAGRPDVGASPQAAALQAATVDYEAAKAGYQRLKNLPTEADLASAQAQLGYARAQLEQAQAGPSPEELAASAGAVDIARARLEQAQAGPRAEDVALAEAEVEQARISLARAEQGLSGAQLLAPFDGMVSEIYLYPGEWAGPGRAVVELLDTGRWRVETRNVGELEIGRVQVGQRAVVRIIAFRERVLGGLVIAISPVGVVQQGDTMYTVVIELEPTDLALRPGMNAEVEIVTTEAGVLPREELPVAVLGTLDLRPWCCSCSP